MALFKRLAWTTIFFLSLTLTVEAETLYVSEIRELSLRSGPGSDHKIASFVSTGQPLTVLETSGDWTRIQTAQGKEGWILTRFLKKEAPSQMAVYELEKKHQQVNTEKTNLASENEALKAKNKAIETELAAAKEAVSRLETNYEKLKKDSTEVLAIKAQAQESAEAVTKEKERADKFENDYALLNYEQRIKWFLSGGGVLLLGFILGFSAKSSRRKTSWR
ncbi:MAG: TIGR04211 family SH3 domain-containing protein [Pseudomonadota bacterium]